MQAIRVGETGLWSRVDTHLLDDLVFELRPPSALQTKFDKFQQAGVAYWRCKAGQAWPSSSDGAQEA